MLLLILQPIPNINKLTSFFLLLGYAIIQIPDFLLAVYYYIKKWARGHTTSKHNNALAKSPISPLSLPRTTISTILAVEKHNESHNPPGTTDQKITELSDKMNIRIEKLERMIEEINRKFKK